MTKNWQVDTILTMKNHLKKAVTNFCQLGKFPVFQLCKAGKWNCHGMLHTNGSVWLRAIQIWRPKLVSTNMRLEITKLTTVGMERNQHFLNMQNLGGSSNSAITLKVLVLEKCTLPFWNLECLSFPMVGLTFLWVYYKKFYKRLLFLHFFLVTLYDEE